MKVRYILILSAVCLFSVCCGRSRTVHISGRVYDKETGAPVRAAVFIENSGDYAAVDSSGTYYITAAPVQNTVIVYAAPSFDTCMVELVVLNSSKRRYAIDVALEKQ